MKKIGLTAACALLLGMLGVIPAMAQGDEQSELVSNWNIRAGFFVPERSGARSAQGDLWLTFGGEHTFYTAERWQGTVSVDYYGSGNLYNVPVLLNAVGETGRMQYGIGAGVGFGHGQDGDANSFVYSLMAGYNLRPGPNPIVGTIRYLGVGGSSSLTGWAFTVGYHF